MMNSQAIINQSNEKNYYKQKGKVGIGYIEESESSKKRAQKNQRPTCNHYGKLGHTSNKYCRNGKAKFNGKCYNCNKHDHRANECKQKPTFEGKCHK